MLVDKHFSRFNTSKAGSADLNPERADRLGQRFLNTNTRLTINWTGQAKIMCVQQVLYSGVIIDNMVNSLQAIYLGHESGAVPMLLKGGGGVERYVLLMTQYSIKITDN